MITDMIMEDMKMKDKDHPLHLEEEEALQAEEDHLEADHKEVQEELHQDAEDPLVEADHEEAE